MDYFCPYCGDELNEKADVDKETEYYKEHGKCSHWDETNRITEF